MIDCGDFVMRSWQKGDEPSLALHANNRKVWANVRDLFPSPYTLKDAKDWVSLARKKLTDTNWAIVKEGEAIGAIGLTEKDDVYQNNIELGYWLGEAFWGQGLMTRAIQGFLPYIFDQFDIQRVYASVFQYNIASMRVLEKAGFRFEARLKQAVAKDGVLMDECIYALMRSEYEAMLPNTRKG